MDPALHRLRRRLERWELPHLRQHAAELAERVEALEREAADLRQQLASAEQRADWWHDQAIEALQALPDGLAPGLTIDGRTCIIAAELQTPPGPAGLPA